MVGWNDLNGLVEELEQKKEIKIGYFKNKTQGFIFVNL